MNFFKPSLLFMAILWLIFPAILFGEDDRNRPPAAGPIDVEIHKSRLMQTDRAITRISVADPKIANYHLITPTQFLVIAANKVGATNLVVWHGDKIAQVYDVNVFIPGDLILEIGRRIGRLVPQARVTVTPSEKGAILSGTVSSQHIHERVLLVADSFGIPIVNLMTVTGSQQVQLEVKIAEVSRSGAKKMGLGFLFKEDLQVGLFPNGGVTGTMTAANSHMPKTTTTVADTISGTISQSTSSGGISQSLTSSMDLLSPFGSAFQLALHGVSDDYLGILSLLKSQGLAQLLATPTLVTMSGQEAEFLVGGEFPIPIQGDNSRTTVEFKRFGIILRFTPYVVGRESITIQVAPEVSNPDYSLAIFSGGVAVPGLKTRRGATTLQLKDGQTFVMAGLLREEMRSTVNKMPLLGDLPVLGTLFTSKEFQQNESELIVMVTPRLVRALNPEEVPALPESTADDVSDLDFFLLNQVPGTASHNSPEPKDAPAPGPPEPPDRHSSTGTEERPLTGFQGQTGMTR
jgi:pilus assembly protein CpaC